MRGALITGGGHRITAREAEVLDLLAAGKRNKEIAQALGIAGSTVKCHVNRIRTRVGQSGRIGLAAWWARQKQPAACPQCGAALGE